MYVSEVLCDHRKDSNEAARKTAKPAPVKESPIVAWLTGAAVKQAIAKAARSLAEGQSEDVIAQVGSLVEESALLKSDSGNVSAVLCLVGGPTTRQAVERSACRARHGEEGCDKGARTQMTLRSAAIGASSTR